MQMRPGKSLVLRVVFLALGLMLAALPSQAEQGTLLGVRLGVHPDKTRIVLDVSARPEYRLSLLSNPNRLVIILPGIPWADVSARLPAPNGVVQGFAGEPAGTGTQLIVRLATPAEIKAADTLLASDSAPARLFVDLVPAASTGETLPEAPVEQANADPAAAALAAMAVSQPPPLPPDLPEKLAAPPPAATAVPPPQPVATTVLIAPQEEIAPPPAEPVKPEPLAAPAPIQKPPTKPELPKSGESAVSLAALSPPLPVTPPQKPATPGGRKWVITLDPGHGGKDPGTVGQGGTQEKDVTLRMALALKEKLEASGHYQVVLTRTRDEPMALRERTERARAVSSDLFISLHADHVDQADLRGASVYTLSENASDAEAAALAAHANKEDLITGVDLSSQSAIVTSILIDLAQRETKNLSARFATILSEELSQRTLTLRNAHRFAGFVVLKAPDVPAVLVELGYLSNKEDEAALASEAHRARLCQAIVKAIERYFEWQRNVKQT
jgi:N-acetylmuramoyl-L-alanine amidase